jgi:transcriptional regulator
MYVPAAFKEDRQDELLEIMRQCTLPVLISPTRDANGLHLTATHLPLLISKDRLVGHIAKANTQWRQIDRVTESLVIFKTVDGYVSPSHYATKQETGKVVPTWNYEAVHAYGRLEIIEDSAKILQIVTALTDHHEKSRAKPWHVSDAPADYIEAQLQGIVGVVLHVTRLEGSRKLSQNKSAADRQGVIAGQQTENPALARQMILAAKGGK